MKIALIHDYLNEFGGAERVLLALSEIWPQAPIYTAFYKKGSPSWQRFKDKDVQVSWAHYLPGFATKLYSPLRFLTPLIWRSFSNQLSNFEVVISSAGWYVTKGFGTRGIAKKKPIEICYCHTPPRWLYGYQTSVEWQRYWPVRIYGAIVGHLMRKYDWQAAQKVNYFIANSRTVARRIDKFYRRKAKIIYPPVELPVISQVKKKDYYLIISRIVGGKGLDLAVKAAVKLGLKLKIAGKPAGYHQEYKKLKKLAGEKVQFLGYVNDKKLAELYAGAKAFLSLASDEDFGITPVEAMRAGTPVIAFRGGGYVESVIDPAKAKRLAGQGATGIFFNQPTVESLIKAIKKLEKIKIKRADCIVQARKFSKARFKREIKKFVLEKI